MSRIAKAKPCPFCKVSDSFVECAAFGSFYRVCNHCGARGPEAEGDGCDETAENHLGARNATRAWNSRANPNLPRPAYVLSRKHLSGWRVVLGYETLEDADAAQAALTGETGGAL